MPVPLTPRPTRSAREVTERLLAVGRSADVLIYAVSALFAVLTWRWSVLAPHRAWASVAAWGYLAAAIIAVGLRTRPARTVLTGLTWTATALLPLVLQAHERAAGRADRAQEEVLVIEAAGVRMLHTGTPYLDRAAIAAVPSPLRLADYLPYQPGMAIAGLPRAIGGVAWWTDARVGMTLLSTVAVVCALLLLGGTRTPLRTEAGLRALQAVTVLPLAALTLATGGDDVPVVALALLACALCVRDRWVAAGVVIGCAGALKLTALPIAVVLGVVVFVRARRFLYAYASAALAIPLLVLVPMLAINTSSVVENIVRFPMGHGLVTSPAASPLPGYLLSVHLPDGRQLVIALLLSSIAGLGAALVHRPPTTVARAALFGAGGLLIAILLMPATRFGYLLYPVVLAAWAPLLRTTYSTAERGLARTGTVRSAR